MEAVAQTIMAAKRINHPMSYRNGTYYCYTGTHYKTILSDEIKNFIILAPVKCGVSSRMARNPRRHEFLVKQFEIEAGLHRGDAAEPNCTFINFPNGTLLFDEKGNRNFVSDNSQWFITYCLNYNYDPNAPHPEEWFRHLTRSGLSQEMQDLLAECFALAFYSGEIEKALYLYGQSATGKSVTLNVYRAILGQENVANEDLHSLTQCDTQGAQARANLGGKLVNICNDTTGTLKDSGILKTLISREPVTVKKLWKDTFSIQKYARLVFGSNQLPRQVFSDPALLRRVVLFEFKKVISPNDMDTNYVKKITDNELPGILNWILVGLERVIKNGSLTIPQNMVDSFEQTRIENDSVYAWLDVNDFCVGETDHIPLAKAFDDYKLFCSKNCHSSLTHNKAFATRLREYGYTTKKLKDGQHLYFSMKNTVVTNEQQPDNQQPYQQQKPDNPQSDRQSILNLLRQHDQAYLREVGSRDYGKNLPLVPIVNDGN